MDELNSEDSLSKARKRLYERDFTPNRLDRSHLSPPRVEVKTTWGNPEAMIKTNANKSSHKLLLKLLGASFIFFLLAVLVALFVTMRGVNVVSDNNINFDIQGPTSLKAGDEINLQITLTNNNKSPLENADLVIQYPAGTKSSTDKQSDLPIFRLPLGTIGAGELVSASSRAIVFGDQNSKEQIKITLEYHLPGSNAIFTKDQTYEYLIGSSPVDVTVDMPTEINADKVFTIDVKASSNSQTPLHNVLLAVDYPTGFQFQSADPAPLSGNSTWNLGDMTLGNDKEIKIMGVLSGQNEDTKAFKFNLGVQNNNGSALISSKYLDVFKTITLKKPFVALGMTINDDSSDTVSINPGQNVNVVVNWNNTLSDDVTQGHLEVHLTGDLLDQNSIKPSGNGFYRSSDNTIIWDGSQSPELAQMAPGVAGNFSFTFKTIPGTSSSQNPAISIDTTFTGLHQVPGNSAEDLKTVISRTVKIQTAASLSANAVYYAGPFSNTGPMPPQVDQETSYTVNWTVANSSNDIQNGQVSAVLPLNVRWLNNFSPNNENVTYDSAARRITWGLGTVASGDTRSLSFQVALTPSLSQVNTPATLLEESTFLGYDTFAGRNVTLSQPALDTNLASDPSFNYSLGKVVN